MFFGGNYIVAKAGARPKRYKSKGLRTAAKGYVLVARTRKDGVTQKYWIRPEDLRKEDKVLRRINNPRATNKLGETVLKGEVSLEKLRRLGAHLLQAKNRGALYKELISKLKVADNMARHTTYKPQEQAKYFIDTYGKQLADMLNADPAKAPELLQRVESFIDYFSKAAPTHTTDMTSLVGMISSGKLLSPKAMFQLHKEHANHEVSTLVAQIRKFLPVRDRDKFQRLIEDGIAPTLKEAEILVLSAHLGKYDATKKAGEYEVTAQKLRDLGVENPTPIVPKGGVDIETLDNALAKAKQSVNALRTYYDKGQAPPRGVHDTNINLINGLVPLVTQMRAIKANKGLDNSADAAVGLDSKFFVGFHSVSRYVAAFENPVTIVFKRDLLKAPGTTIAPINAPLYGGTQFQRAEIPAEIKATPKEIKEGKYLLADIDNPDTILALALYSAAKFNSVSEYLATYVEGKTPGTTSSGRPETKKKPFDRAEAHVPTPTNFDHVEKFIFNHEADATLFTHLFPEYKDRVEFAFRDESYEVSIDDIIDDIRDKHVPSTRPASPFKLKEGRYIVERT